jgi:hypothetical protein
MVRRVRISSRRGMAAMFDALIFLTAVSVVAVGGLLLSLDPADDGEAMTQELVESSHAMLFQMTVQLPDREGVALNESGAPLVKIGTISLGLFQDTNEEVILPSWLNSTVSDALGRILEPRYSFIWMLSDGKTQLWLRPGPSMPSDGDIFVSMINLGGSPQVRSTLFVWMSR